MRAVAVLLLVVCFYGALGQEPTPDIGAEAGKVDELQVRLGDTETGVNDSNIKLEELQKLYADVQTRLSINEQELVVAKSRIDALEKERSGVQRVAFYAALTTFGYVGPYNTDITLKYNKVFTNVGQAHNASTGYFTAPVSGVYYFQFTVCGSKSGLTGAALLKNNAVLMLNSKWKDDLWLEYFTNSVILELSAGDVVELRLPTGNTVYDDVNNQTTFSGALLFAM